MTKLERQGRLAAFRWLLEVNAKEKGSLEFTTVELMHSFRLWTWKTEGLKCSPRMCDALVAVDSYRTPGTWSVFAFHDRLERQMLSTLEREGFIARVPQATLHTWKLLKIRL